MTALVNFINSVKRNDEGQDLLEYALLVALIAVVCIAAVSFLGQQAKGTFNKVGSSIAGA